MNALFLVAGVVLLLVSVVDLLWTTLWVEGGGGPLTSRVTARSWTFFRWLGSRTPRVRTLSGPAILIAALSVWLVLLWAGWTLVFASGETALRDTLGTRSVSWPDLIYVTGYTIFTLGNGDFVPQGARWQLLTALAAASGMLFVTLSVTYVLSVLGAVTQKRAFASGVSGLGTSGEEIVRTSWDGEAFRGLDTTLPLLTSQLNTLTANHKAYPILHYFHSEQPGNAPARSVVVFDEALTLLRFGVVPDRRPNDLVVTGARASVEGYLETLHAAFVEPADRSPPTPALEAIGDAGVPAVSEAAFEASIADLEERRRTLLGVVESDVRQWPSDG